MELHIDIGLSGDGFPTETEKLQIDRLLSDLDGSVRGSIVDTGAGRGHADVFLRIKPSDEKHVITAVRGILDQGPFSGCSTIRVLRGKRPTGKVVRLPNPGDAFTFPVFETKFGCCRVLRTPTSGEEVFFGGAAVLVATSAWIGDCIPTVDNPALRETLVLTHHSHRGRKEVFWTSHALPDSYHCIGRIEPSLEEMMEKCNVHGSWACEVQVEAQHVWDQSNHG